MRIVQTFSRATVIACLALFTGPAQAGAGQQADEARGAAVLAEARKALGGEEKLAAVKRLQVTGTSRRANGNFNLEGDTEVFIELPDKFRRNESLTMGGSSIDRTEILNGNEVVNETSGGDFAGRFGRGRFGGGFPGGGAPAGGAAPDGRGGAGPDGRAGQPVDQERLREFQRRNLQSDVSRLLLAILLTSQAPVAWIGTAQSPDGSADVLEMKTPDGAATRLFIDSSTRLPLMLTWTGPAGRGFGGRGGQGRRGQGGAQGAEPGARGDAATSSPAAAEPSGAGAGPDGGQGRRGRGAQGPPATLEMHLAEYKNVNGIKFPHLITRGASGETNEEWIIKGYKVNPNFKANTFTK